MREKAEKFAHNGAGGCTSATQSRCAPVDSRSSCVGATQREGRNVHELGESASATHQVKLVVLPNVFLYCEPTAPPPLLNICARFRRRSLLAAKLHIGRAQRSRSSPAPHTHSRKPIFSAFASGDESARIRFLLGHQRRCPRRISIEADRCCAI